MTRTAHSPGELLLDVIAARILTSAGSLRQDNPGQLAGATAGLRAFVGDGPGHIVAALQAVGALPPSSPAPGQLAGLCARLGITGHGITTPPTADLPERWLSMLTRYHRRSPQPLNRWRQRRSHRRAGDRPAARGGYPMDRPGGRRAIGPGTDRLPLSWKWDR